MWTQCIYSWRSSFLSVPAPLTPGQQTSTRITSTDDEKQADDDNGENIVEKLGQLLDRGSDGVAKMKEKIAHVVKQFESVDGTDDEPQNDFEDDRQHDDRSSSVVENKSDFQQSHGEQVITS